MNPNGGNFPQQQYMPNNPFAQFYSPQQVMNPGLEPPRKKRGRPKGSGRGGSERARGGSRGRRRGRGRGSSSESDEDFFDSSTRTTEIQPRTIRSHITNSSNYRDDDDDLFSEDEEIGSRGDGPSIEYLYCKQDHEQEPTKYLCKWIGESPLHSTFIVESEIRSGANSHQYYTEYINKTHDSGELCSNAAPDCVEPANSPFDINIMCVDRIIAHRSQDKDSSIKSEYYDPSVFVSGLPIRQNRPFDHILPYSNHLYSSENDPFILMNDNGIFTNPICDKSALNSYSDDSQQTEDPTKIDLLIQWRNTSPNDSAWEKQSSFMNDDNLFCIGNYEEFKQLLNIYLNKINQKHQPEIELDIPDELICINDLILTEPQEELVRQLFEAKMNNTSIQIVSEGQSGRVTAIVTFLQMLHSQFGRNQPTIIITTEYGSAIWKKTLKLFSTLYWVDYLQSSHLIRNHEIIDTPKLDILITTDEMFNDDPEIQKRIQYENLIIDTIHGPVGELKIENESAFVIFIAETVNTEIGLHPIEISSTPLHFTEKVIMVNNPICTSINLWLRRLLKTKSLRSVNVSSMQFILNELALADSHPLLVPRISQSLIEERMTSLSNQNIPETTRQLSFISQFSGKVQKLFEIISKTALNINEAVLVIAENLSVLRLIQLFLNAYHIPNGILVTNIKKETLQPSFQRGVILSNRSLEPPQFRRFSFVQIIFFDVPINFQDEVDFVQFMMNKPSQAKEFVHLINKNSIESEIFIKCVKYGSFNYRDIPKNHTDKFLRSACYLSQSNPEFVQNTEFTLEFPVDISEMKQQLNSVIKTVKNNPEFWDTVFAAKMKEKAFWKKKDCANFMTLLLQYGLNHWKRIATEIEKPLDEVIAYGKSVLITMMLQYKPDDLARQNLSNALIYLELNNNNGYDNEFDNDCQYWNLQAEQIPPSHLQTFQMSTPISQMIKNRRSIDSFMDVIENVSIVRAFLSIRQHPYIPLRFFVQINNKFTSPDFFYIFLENYLQYPNNIVSLREALQIEPEFTYDYFVVLVKRILSAVTIDLFSFVLHAIENSTSEALFEENALLRPFILIFEKGPYLWYWSDNETQTVLDTISDFSIPLRPDGEYDWYEFHSLLLLTSKSTDMIQKYTSHVIELLLNQEQKKDVIIEPEFTKIDEISHPLPPGKPGSRPPMELNPRSQVLPLNQFPTAIQEQQSISEQQQNYMQQQQMLQHYYQPQNPYQMPNNAVQYQQYQVAYPTSPHIAPTLQVSQMQLHQMEQQKQMQMQLQLQQMNQKKGPGRPKKEPIPVPQFQQPVNQQHSIQPIVSQPQIYNKIPEPIHTIRSPTPINNYSKPDYSYVIIASIAYKLKHMTSSLLNLRKFSREPPKIIRQVSWLPESWNYDCDVALINGICQFGFKQIKHISSVDFTAYANCEYFDVHIENSLSEFQNSGSFFPQRLRFLLLWNMPIKRHLSFVCTPIQKIRFVISNPNKPFCPIDNKQDDQEEKGKKTRKPRGPNKKTLLQQQLEEEKKAAEEEQAKTQSNPKEKVKSKVKKALLISDDENQQKTKSKRRLTPIEEEQIDIVPKKQPVIKEQKEKVVKEKPKPKPIIQLPERMITFTYRPTPDKIRLHFQTKD